LIHASFYTLQKARKIVSEAYHNITSINIKQQPRIEREREKRKRRRRWREEMFRWE
jgi:hypothetical protein